MTTTKNARIQIGSEKQSVVKHLLDGLEQVRGEGIDIEDEAKEHHRRRTTTKTKTTKTLQQQENKKRQKHKKLAWSFKFMALHFFLMKINNIF